MRRFYNATSVDKRGSGYTVLLDGLPVRTPGKAELIVPNRPLANAIADEWRSQGETVRQDEMHLNKLAATAIDRPDPMAADLVDTIVAYARTDLLCHRVESPIELARRQIDAWQPLLDWADATYGARLNVTTGIVPAIQPDAAVAALRTVVEQHNGMRLEALHNATTLLGSIVLGLALLAGRIKAATAFDASQIDETYQLERWGEDAEAASRRAGLRREIEATERFARLLRADEPA